MDVTPEQGAKLLHEVNQLRSDVMLFIAGLTVAFLFYQIFIKIIAARRERQAEEAKNERARQFKLSQERQSEAIESLAASVSEQTASTEAINSTMRSVGEVVGELKGTMGVFVAKSEGRINREDSIRMIRDRFIQNVYRDFCGVIEVSLRENDYENRKDYVTRRVKTMLGKILTEARRYLGSYTLSVDPDVFFVASKSDRVERFILCDQVWNEVEPLYRKDHSTPEALKQRVEEALLLVENCIKDYVTMCGRGGDVQIDFRETGHISSPSSELMERSTRLLTRTGSFRPLRSDYDDECDDRAAASGG